MALRFARDFEVLIAEVDSTISRAAAYSTPGKPCAAADVVVKDVVGGVDVDTYVPLTAATAGRMDTAAIALNRDDGDGFTILTGIVSVKKAVVRWPEDAPTAAAAKVALAAKKIVAL